MNNSNIKVFIVEDNELYGSMLALKLQQKTEFDISVFKSGEELFQNIEYGEMPDIVISDYQLSLQGEFQTAFQLVEKLSTMDSSIPVVILSARKDMKTAIEILKLGAFDFILKDDDAFHQIIISVEKVAKLIKVKKEIALQKITKSKDVRRMVVLFGLTTLVLLAILLFR